MLEKNQFQVISRLPFLFLAATACGESGSTAIEPVVAKIVDDALFNCRSVLNGIESHTLHSQNSLIPEGCVFPRLDFDNTGRFFVVEGRDAGLTVRDWVVPLTQCSDTVADTIYYFDVKKLREKTQGSLVETVEGGTQHVNGTFVDFARKYPRRSSVTVHDANDGPVWGCLATDVFESPESRAEFIFDEEELVKLNATRTAIFGRRRKTVECVRESLGQRLMCAISQPGEPDIRGALDIKKWDYPTYLAKQRAGMQKAVQAAKAGERKHLRRQTP